MKVMNRRSPCRADSGIRSDEIIFIATFGQALLNSSVHSREEGMMATGTACRKQKRTKAECRQDDDDCTETDNPAEFAVS